MAVPEVFADTSGWANYFVRHEPFHPRTVGIMDQWQAGRATVVTTNFVLAEFVASLTSRFRVPHPGRIQITDAIRSASWVEIVHIDPTLEAEAWALLKARPDKNWSLVDCASFVVMTHRGITDALTADHHFDQAGFARLLK